MTNLAVLPLMSDQHIDGCFSTVLLVDPHDDECWTIPMLLSVPNLPSDSSVIHLISKISCSKLCLASLKTIGVMPSNSRWRGSVDLATAEFRLCSLRPRSHDENEAGALASSLLSNRTYKENRKTPDEPDHCV